MKHLLDADELFNTAFSYVFYAIVIGAVVIYGIKFLKDLWED